MTDLLTLLAEHGALLADGATGTSCFEMGLVAGDPPELWNADAPDKVRSLHRGFVGAGSDLILTNTFGANRDRLKLHGADGRVTELNRRGAALAREIADQAGRPVIVAGSMGPLGELFEPLGALTAERATAAFVVQAEGLKAGGADLCWIETMSSVEEIRAAATGAIAAGMPYAVTASFDTAGRTMMGLEPARLPAAFGGLAHPPVAYGANCGVGAADLLVALLDMRGAAPEALLIAKANCGVPQVRGDHVHYTGTPELMADYAGLAVDIGAGIVGGCCGTSPRHVAAMRVALDGHVRSAAPNRAAIEATLGPLVAPPPSHARAGRDRRSGRGRTPR